MQETLIPTRWPPPCPAPGAERADPTLQPDARSSRMTLVHETKKKREEKERKNNKKKCYMLSVHVLPNYKSCKQEHNFHVTLKYIMYY